MTGNKRTTREQAGAPPPRWRHPAALLTLVLVGMLAAQMGWLALNRRPVEYDSAWYLEIAVTLRRVLLEQGWTAFLDQARAAFGFKAPGVSMAAALAMAAVGESVQRAVAINLVAWLAAATYLYLLARRFLSAEASALAALLASATPIAFSLARSMLVESWLTAAVVAFLFHAAASDRLRRPGHVVMLAVWGAAGLMVKVTFPAFVVLPGLLLSLTPWRDARPRVGRILAAWTLVAGISAGVAAWLWYAANWRTILDYTRNAGFGQLSAEYAVPIPIFLAAVVTHAASPWTVVSASVLLALALLRRPEEANRWAAPRLALAWLALPVVMVLSSGNRYGRYLAGALPALALAVGALAEPWLRRSARAVALALTVLVGPPLAYFTVATIPTPLAGAVRGWVEASWLGISVNWYEGPPDQRPWPNAAIVLAASRSAGNGAPAVLRLNVDLPELNHNNLKLEALLQRAPVMPAQIDQSSPDGALATALEGDLLLLQTGGEVAVDFLNVQRAVVARELASGRYPYREVASFEVPAGRRVALLARRCAVEAEPTPGVPLAELERGLEVLSLQVARPTDGLVAIQTRYRARSGSHPMLAVLVQVAGPDGRVLGGQEHLLCRRPLRPWPAGALLDDTFLLPAGAAAPGLGLRLGLRDLQTGAPLRVEQARAGIGSADGAALVIPDWSARLGPSSAP